MELAEALWPIAVMLSVLIISIASYMSSEVRERLVNKRMEQAARAQERAHNLELERERTLRSQTTWPWPQGQREDS